MGGGEKGQRIFDPIFTAKRQEGIGLGLSINQMQGGKISVGSNPGKGTTSAAWLPEAPLMVTSPASVLRCIPAAMLQRFRQRRKPVPI